MIPRKVLEAAFGRWWLLLLPVILTPLLVLAVSNKNPQYRSTATVWVSQPAGINPTTFSGGSNPYQTPAAVQVQALQDLLSTKSFRLAIAQGAGLQGDAGADFVGKAVRIEVNGSNLIAISADAPDAPTAQSIVSSVITQYQSRTTAESARQAAITVDYYNKQIGEAQTELDTRNKDLTAYVQANPKVVDGKTVDLEYQRLLSAVESQQKIADGLLTSLQDAQRSASTATQSLEATFSVQDAANLPDAPEPIAASRRFGYPFAGLALGALIAASYLYIVVRTDHAIRSAEDLENLPVPLLGYIPYLPAAGTGRAARVGPWAWFVNHRRRDYARAVAASISVVPAREVGQ